GRKRSSGSGRAATPMLSNSSKKFSNKEGMKMIVRTFFLIALVTLVCAQAGSVKAPWAAAAAPLPIGYQPLEAVPGPGPVQRPGLLAGEGANLSGRMDAALRLGRAAQSRYWTAYAFDVRPGVSVDVDWDGKRTSAGGGPPSL